MIFSSYFYVQVSSFKTASSSLVIVAMQQLLDILFCSFQPKDALSESEKFMRRSKDPKLSLKQRKEALVEHARQKYIDKHGVL